MGRSHLGKQSGGHEDTHQLVNAVVNITGFGWNLAASLLLQHFRQLRLERLLLRSAIGRNLVDDALGKVTQLGVVSSHLHKLTLVKDHFVMVERFDQAVGQLIDVTVDVAFIDDELGVTRGIGDFAVGVQLAHLEEAFHLTHLSVDREFAGKILLLRMVVQLNVVVHGVESDCLLDSGQDALLLLGEFAQLVVDVGFLQTDMNHFDQMGVALEMVKVHVDFEGVTVIETSSFTVECVGGGVLIVVNQGERFFLLALALKDDDGMPLDGRYGQAVVLFGVALSVSTDFALRNDCVA